MERTIDSRSDFEILLGVDGVHPYAEWDLLRELDRREKMKTSISRKEANKRARKNNPLTKAYRKKYDHNIVSPRRKATRQWMAKHPEVVDEIKTRRM